jgi:hypothetical protein
MVPWPYNNRLLIFYNEWGNSFGVMEFFSPGNIRVKIVLKFLEINTTTQHWQEPDCLF